jgi:hypothetical protein
MRDYQLVYNMLGPLSKLSDVESVGIWVVYASTTSTVSSKKNCDYETMDR